MKVKFPDGHGKSFSVEGKEFVIDKNGVASGLSPEQSAVAASHGAVALAEDDEVASNEEERTELEMVLDGNVEEVTDALPEWNDEALILLADYESNGKTRKGVIAAIEAEQKRRADAAE